MPRAKGSIDMVRMKVPNPVDKYVGSRVRMRRMMLDMSQTDLAHEIGLTFQQVQKYEKGSNRMGASRLQQMANILQVPITFFFDGAPNQSKIDGKAQSPAFVTEFLASSDGLALTRAFTRLSNGKLRRSIVALVEQIAGDD
jgi:transcriptional regulator with XRE-family HTH domain